MLSDLCSPHSSVRGAPTVCGLADPALPGPKNKILNRIRSITDGKLNDPRFPSRMSGEGISPARWLRFLLSSAKGPKWLAAHSGFRRLPSNDFNKYSFLFLSEHDLRLDC